MLEYTNGVGEDRIVQAGPKSASANDIDLAFEEVGQAQFNPHEIVEADMRGRVEFDEDIDIGRCARIASCNAAEDGRVADAGSLKIPLVLA